MRSMGMNAARTQADDVADAAAAVEAARREMNNWLAHLARMADPSVEVEAVAMQARRSGRIVAALVAEAEDKTRAAAVAHGPLLRSVL